MHIGHLRLREEVDENLVETAGSCGHRGNVEMLRLLMHILRRLSAVGRCPSVLDNIQEFVQIRDDAAGIAVHGIPVANLLHLVGDEILHLQHMLHQLYMRDIVGMGFPQIEKDVLQLVGHSRDIVEHHDARRAFDGVHGPEYLIDAVFIKAVGIFLLQDGLLKLFQQLAVLEQIHIQHAFCVKISRHIYLLS